MIKKGVLLLVLLLLAGSLVSAVEVEMNREFQQSSLFSAKVSGSFINPPLKENILFYRDGHVRVSITPEVIKVADDYYISATLPQMQKNFSMVISNVSYYNGTKIVDDDLEENFSTTGERAVFSATPGVIMTDKDFSIKIQNLQPGKRTIISQISDLGDSFELQSGQIKEITFDSDRIEPLILNYLKLSSGDTSYSIPVYIFQNISEAAERKSFEFDPSFLNLTLPTASSGTRIVYLNNTGKETLSNILFIISNSMIGIVNLSVDNLSELEEGSKVRLEVDFLPQEGEGSFEGHIAAKEGNTYIYLPISVNFLAGFIPNENDSYDPYANTTLIDDTPDGGSSWGGIIGWTLVILVVLFVLWFFSKKYRGAKGNPINLIKIGSRKK